MGRTVDKIVDTARDTASFFTGGTSGVNVGRGEAPTKQTLMTDASGLAAGAGLAGSGLLDAGAAAGAGEAVASASPQGLNPALAGGYGGVGLNPAAAGGVGLNPATGAAAFDSALSPGMQALLNGGGTALGSLNYATPLGGVSSPGGATGAAPSAAPGAAPAAPATPAGSAAGAGGGAAPAATGGQQGGIVDQILKGMRDNAGLAQLGLTGAALAMNAKQRPIPNEQQLNDLAATGSQAAKDLISSYRSGQLSAAQQAGLDQLTQGTKNQINQYFASIGQSDSTAHMQALAQVDQQALGMKQQMLDNMLNQGLQAIGVAQGPLGTIANYRVQQDKNLTDAFGNFANAVGQVFGRQAGTQAPKPNPNPSVTGTTPSTGAGQSAP